MLQGSQASIQIKFPVKTLGLSTGVDVVRRLALSYIYTPISIVCRSAAPPNRAHTLPGAFLFESASPPIPPFMRDLVHRLALPAA